MGRESSKKNPYFCFVRVLFALNELGENHKQPLIVEFILENLSERNNLKTNKDYLFWKVSL